MQINLETIQTHSIQSYSNTAITIQDNVYEESLIVSSDTIMTPWKIKHITALTHEILQPIISLAPKILIIGHTQLGSFPPITTLQQLSQLGIGIETMAVGAACRTFNVLLSEHRAVVLGIIF